MFGYIRPFKPNLKMAEYETYKAIYCGVCKQLGRSYSQPARFLLSYDMTFFALFALAVNGSSVSYKRQICAAHPVQKKPCLLACEELRHTANLSILMAYYKLLDNMQDSRHSGYPYKALSPVFKNVKRKAMKQLPETDEILQKMIAAQTEIENMQTDSIDKASHPTADALGKIAQQISPNKHENDAFYRLGYMLGRFIYLLDALDDLEQDQKNNCYNPFLVKYPSYSPEKIQQPVLELLHLTIAQMASAYELITIKQFKSILDNIIYQGLFSSMQIVLNKKQLKEKKNEQSIPNIGNRQERLG